MSRSTLRSVGRIIAGLVLLGICLVFPRAFAFAELARIIHTLSGADDDFHSGGNESSPAGSCYAG